MTATGHSRRPDGVTGGRRVSLYARGGMGQGVRLQKYRKPASFYTVRGKKHVLPEPEHPGREGSAGDALRDTPYI